MIEPLQAGDACCSTRCSLRDDRREGEREREREEFEKLLVPNVVL